MMEDNTGVVTNVPGMHMQVVEKQLDKDTGITNINIPLAILDGVDEFDVMLIKKDSLNCVTSMRVSLFSTPPEQFNYYVG